MAARNFFVRSPKEEESSAAIREAVLLGGKNAAIAGTVVAVPTVRICVRNSSVRTCICPDFCQI
uniref:Uncharacterized protein n=1 Tax=Aegilops tauschii subsp. strangulata TaxID=200361 RepID=A0A453QTP1_AEGTS